VPELGNVPPQLAALFQFPSVDVPHVTVVAKLDVRPAPANAEIPAIRRINRESDRNRKEEGKFIRIRGVRG
jgi:hypothetical protein